MKWFFLVLDLIVAALGMVQLMNAQNANQRGTNTVTRFVRDVGSNFIYGKVQAMCIGATLVFMILGFICGGFWICLPTLIPVVMSFVFKNKSTHNQQRVKDARTVTKGSLEVVAATGEEIGEAVGTVAALAGDKVPVVGSSIGKAGGAIGKAVGKTAGAVSGKAAQQMTDVASTGISKEDMSGVNEVLKGVSGGGQKVLAERNSGLNEIPVKRVAVANPTAFLEAAIRTGMAKEGDDPGMVAGRVYAMMPESAKNALADKDEGEAAMLFLEGKV